MSDIDKAIQTLTDWHSALISETGTDDIEALASSHSEFLRISRDAAALQEENTVLREALIKALNGQEFTISFNLIGVRSTK